MEQSAHILVVDDHQDIRELLSKYLSRNGYRVSDADGGTKMRQLLKTSAIDLIVLDVMMPGEDGLTLCRHVRENENIPVILLTALGEETDRIVGLEIGGQMIMSPNLSTLVNCWHASNPCCAAASLCRERHKKNRRARGSEI